MRILLTTLGISALLVVAAIFFVDDPVARFIHDLSWAEILRSPVLGMPILLTLSGVAVILLAACAANGYSLSKFAEIVIVVSFSLTFSVCIVEFVLKRIFGRETPDEFLQNGIDTFHWFQGTPINSFPSGHAVQIVSVGTVLLVAYPRHRAAWLSIMGLGLIVLVLGNWHFVSDVVAGAAVGAVCGSATVTLWRLKSDRISN